MEAGAQTQRGRSSGPIGRAWIAVGLVAAIVVGLAIGIGVHLLTRASSPPATVVNTRFGMHGEAAWAAGTRAAPAIDTLRDQTGQVFSLASLRGRTVAVVFFDSHCHAACPLQGRALAAAERSLPAGERPVLVAVSVNPADTPASAARAAHAWGLSRVSPWHWVMGTRAQLAPIWAAYHVYVSPHPIDGDIAHTEALYLVDRRGDERSAYMWPFAGKFVTADLRTLAGTSAKR
jgi:cytochrome oxidase Cu insertion factor (SCO1/SenC/PrrC family)